MAFTEKQLREITAMMNAIMEKMRPPEHMRSEVDMGWRIERQSVILFEIMPRWDDPSAVDEIDFAKATWVHREKEWNIYWVRPDNKWYRYPPLESVVNLQRFIIEIEKDPYGCFRG